MTVLPERQNDDEANRPVYIPDLKIDAARGMAAGESPKLLSQELGVPRQQLYAWHTVLRERGEEALRTDYGRPNKSQLLAMEAAQEDFAEARNLVEHASALPSSSRRLASSG